MPPRKDEQAETGGTARMRLQRFLAAAGLGSRRQCEEYITAGRVSINGQDVPDLGVTVDPAQDKVRVDGELVRAEPKRYYILNKPPGYVCTHRDPAGRSRAIDLMPKSGPRLFTVGRLDENSQGLLLVTNDGELSNRLAHPRYHVERTYRVQVAGVPTPDVFQQLKRGMHFTEGVFRVKSIKKLKTAGKSTFLELVLTEGQNREIRRLLARAGHKVLHLERIGFGPLRLGKLVPGEFRPLRPAEVNELMEFARRPGGKGPRGTRTGGGAKSAVPGAARGRKPAKKDEEQRDRPHPAQARARKPSRKKTPSKRGQ